MRNQLQIFAVVIFTLFAFSNVFANSTYSVATDALATRLQHDLELENVTVKFTKVNSYNVSKNVIGLKGSGVANNLPIKFNVKINKAKLVPTSVEYSLVEPNFTTASAEDSLVRNLLDSLNQEYKTSNIVMAIDYFDNEKITDNQTKYVGTGEARVGFDWKKIKFEVIKEDATNKAISVKYEILK